VTLTVHSTSMSRLSRPAGVHSLQHTCLHNTVTHTHINHRDLHGPRAQSRPTSQCQALQRVSSSLTVSAASAADRDVTTATHVTHK